MLFVRALHTQYLWPISPISLMQCFYGPQGYRAQECGTLRLLGKERGMKLED